MSPSCPQPGTWLVREKIKINGEHISDESGVCIHISVISLMVVFPLYYPDVVLTQLFWKSFCDIGFASAPVILHMKHMNTYYIYLLMILCTFARRLLQKEPLYHGMLAHLRNLLDLLGFSHAAVRGLYSKLLCVFGDVSLLREIGSKKRLSTELTLCVNSGDQPVHQHRTHSDRESSHTHPSFPPSDTWSVSAYGLLVSWTRRCAWKLSSRAERR